MITRIVKLTFREEEILNFSEIFKEVNPKIRNFNGCISLIGYQDLSNPCIFFTYSKWDSEQHLLNYRNSSLFKDIWDRTKVLFASKAEAWSITEVA